MIKAPQHKQIGVKEDDALSADELVKLPYGQLAKDMLVLWVGRARMELDACMGARLASFRAARCCASDAKHRPESAVIVAVLLCAYLSWYVRLVWVEWIRNPWHL